MSKTFSQTDDAIASYVEKTFHPESADLAAIRERSQAAGMPNIHVGEMDGLHLEIFVRATGAKKIVEIGTLAGYSGTRMALAMPKDGHLYTFEFEPLHAKIAAETFKNAGLADRATIFVGAALENLKKIEKDGPFDLVFIDADKVNYPGYLDWAITNLRVGGAILGDNTFAWGMIADDEAAQQGEYAEAVQALRKFNTRAATDPRLRATILPTGEGLTFAVKVK